MPRSKHNDPNAPAAAAAEAAEARADVVTATLHGCDVVVPQATGTDVFEVFRALRAGRRVEVTRLYPGFSDDHAVRDHVRASMRRFVDAAPHPALPAITAVDDDVWLVQGFCSRCVGVGSLVHQMKQRAIPLDLQLVADVVVPLCGALEAVGSQRHAQPRAVVVDVDGAVSLWCAEQIQRPQRPIAAPHLASSLADLMVLLLGGRPGARLSDVAPELCDALDPVIDACRSEDPPSLPEIAEALRDRAVDVDTAGAANMADLVRALFGH